MAANSPGSSVTIPATPAVPRTREQKIDEFNSMRVQEHKLDREKQIMQKHKHERMKALRKLQNEVEALGKKEAALEETHKGINTRKRDLMATMSHEEQLSFVYEAGKAAGNKLSRQE